MISQASLDSEARHARREVLYGLQYMHLAPGGQDAFIQRFVEYCDHESRRIRGPECDSIWSIWSSSSHSRRRTPCRHKGLSKHFSRWLRRYAVWVELDMLDFDVWATVFVCYRDLEKQRDRYFEDMSSGKIDSESQTERNDIGSTSDFSTSESDSPGSSAISQSQCTSRSTSPCERAATRKRSTDAKDEISEGGDRAEVRETRQKRARRC